MAILSFVAITLLSATQALQLPSRSVGGGLERFQRRHADLNAETLSSLQTTLRTMPQDIERSHASYEASPQKPGVDIMQVDDAACSAAMEAPCVEAPAMLLSAIQGASSAGAAATAVMEQCAVCGAENITAQYDAVIAACESTGDELTRVNNMRAVAEASCADPTCTGNFVWSATRDMNRTLICPNIECGIPVLVAGERLLDPTINATEVECRATVINTMCITDASDSSIYCSDLLMRMGNETAAFCMTSCPGSYQTALEAAQACMGPMDGGMSLLDDHVHNGDEDECHEDAMSLNLPALCIQNGDGEYCQEIFSNEENMPNVSLCPAALFGDAVPAPGAEVVAPTECSAECTAQLQAFVDDVGCCVGSMLARDCGAEATVRNDFINSTCGVATEACVVPTFTEAPTTEPEGTVGTTSSFAVAQGVSVAVASILGVIAFATLF